jgi:hypothetical protein
MAGRMIYQELFERVVSFLLFSMKSLVALPLRDGPMDHDSQKTLRVVYLLFSYI